MTSITDVTWDRAWQNKVRGLYDDIPVFFLGRTELIANKRATGRPQDLANVAALESGTTE